MSDQVRRVGSDFCQKCDLELWKERIDLSETSRFDCRWKIFRSPSSWIPAAIYSLNWSKSALLLSKKPKDMHGSNIDIWMERACYLQWYRPA